MSEHTAEKSCCCEINTPLLLPCNARPCTPATASRRDAEAVDHTTIAGEADHNVSRTCASAASRMRAPLASSIALLPPLAALPVAGNSSGCRSASPRSGGTTIYAELLLPRCARRRTNFSRALLHCPIAEDSSAFCPLPPQGLLSTANATDRYKGRKNDRLIPRFGPLLLSARALQGSSLNKQVGSS